MSSGLPMRVRRVARNGSTPPRVPDDAVLVTVVRAARLLDSAGRPARFVTVTAAPLDCGAVSVWLADEAEICSPQALANAGL